MVRIAGVLYRDAYHLGSHHRARPLECSFDVLEITSKWLLF